MKGPWENGLACPEADTNPGPSCYLQVPPNSVDGQKSKNELEWEKVFHAGYHNDRFEHAGEFMRDVVAKPEACEWNIDGNMLNWVPQDEHKYRCDEPSESLTALGEVCKSPGFSSMTWIDMVRHVAQKEVPFRDDVKAAMRSAASECKKASQGKKTLAIHVRRTDKINHEDRLYYVEEYIEAAKKQNWDFDVVSIMTDDPVAVKGEMDKLQMEYFLAGDVMTGRKIENNERPRNHHEDHVFMLQELACMTAADYFVASRKSNLPWVVQVHRTQSPSTAIDVTTGEMIHTMQL